MKKNVLLFWLLFCVVIPVICTNAQGTCLGGNTVVLDNIDHSIAFQDIIYKTAPGIDEIDLPNMVNLGLRVYYPTDLATNESRPLVVLIHGGFFIGGSYGDFAPLAQELAQIGFVAATIDYRLCQRNDCLLAGATSYPCNTSWGYSLLPSAYVAMIDAADAIRYLQNHAAEFHINSNKVIVGGHSAGALTTLHLAYLDADELAPLCGGCGTWPDYMAEPIVPLTGIKAIMPMSGAIYDPNWIDANESNISVALIHGTNDGVVPYDYDEMVECCPNVPFPYMYGACPIAERLSDIGANYELITGLDCSHDIFSGGFFNNIKEEVAAFLIKTVVCGGSSIERHLIYTPPGPENICPPFPLYSADAANTCGLPLDTPYDLTVGVSPAAPESLGWKVHPTLITHNTLYISQTFQPDNSADVYAIQISDITGRVVYHQQSQNSSANIAIATDQWAQGIYFVQIIDSKNRVHSVQKVIKP